MKQLGLDANSTCVSRKIYWKIFQDVSTPPNSVPTLKWSIYGPTLPEQSSVAFMNTYFLSAHVIFKLQSIRTNRFLFSPNWSSRKKANKIRVTTHITWLQQDQITQRMCSTKLMQYNFKGSLCPAVERDRPYLVLWKLGRSLDVARVAAKPAGIAEFMRTTKVRKTEENKKELDCVEHWCWRQACSVRRVLILGSSPYRNEFPRQFIRDVGQLSGATMTLCRICCRRAFIIFLDVKAGTLWFSRINAHFALEDLECNLAYVLITQIIHCF